MTMGNYISLEAEFARTLHHKGFPIDQAVEAVKQYKDAHGFEGSTYTSDVAQEYLARDIGAGCDAWQRENGIGRYS